MSSPSRSLSRTDPASRPATPPWGRIGVFMLIATGFHALCALPFWILEDGISHPLYSWVISIGMFGPLIASVVLAKAVERTSWRESVSLQFRGRWKSLALWIPLAVIVMLTLNILSAVLMVLRGVPGDLSGQSWAALLTEQLSEAGAPMPTAAAVALVLGATVFNLLVTVVPAFGEEIGWRGWLWQRLKPAGFTVAITLGGVLWSLWHLPVTLIGHNYPGAPRSLAIGMFLIACVAMNFLFGAITERCGGNPIPAAFAHATLNSTLGVIIAIVSTSETAEAMNWFIDTPLGAVGIALLVVAAYVIMPRDARSSFGGSGDAPPGIGVE